jgi:hypothetical protein
LSSPESVLALTKVLITSVMPINGIIDNAL